MAQASMAATDQRPGCISPPGIGEAVWIRNRQGVVVYVDPFVAPHRSGLRLVQVVYGDGRRPASEHILWGLEGDSLVGPAGIRLADRPTDALHLRALAGLRRWTVPAPFPGMATDESLPRTPVAPLYSGVTPLPHQLVPLEQALAQPVVRLLLADGVGLGKTVEAGLLINELLIRRRIARILVLAPPALREQWQQEMWHCFALDFRVIDGPFSRVLKQEMGKRVSPWEVYPRIITSPHYLRQPAILETFLSSCRTGPPEHPPWDLLVVDEAHHLAPGKGGDDSRLTVMLKAIAPWFEHRVFITATPHNGHHASFTGLLEILDPVRFSKSAAPSPQEVARQREVVIRRTRRRPLPGNQPTALVIPVVLQLSPLENRVFSLFALLKRRLVRWATGAGSQGLMGATLCLEVLGKRLLSSWPAFASSYRAFLAGVRRGGGSFLSPEELPEAAGSEVSEQAWHRVSTRLGRWLARHYPDRTSLFDELADALANLEMQLPEADTRMRAWLDWVHRTVAQGERAVVFTEYLASLDYLAASLRQRQILPEGAVAALHGGSSVPDRCRAIASFVEPKPGVQLLLCTDILAEGLNLQRSARSLFHFDVPWNPVVLQQRLGRLDRLGQTRQVRSYHFRCDALEEARLHGKVFAKTARIDQSIGAGNAVLAPLATPSPSPGPQLLELAAVPLRDQDPPVCARGNPRPSTSVRLEAFRARTLGKTEQFMAVLNVALGAYGLDLATTAGGGIRLADRANDNLGHEGLLSLLAGPCGEAGFPVHLPRLFPGHPLLHWLLARITLSFQPAAVPWLAHRCGDLDPGVLVLAIEFAATTARPILHQGMLPIWLPLKTPAATYELGPGELASTEQVDRLLSLPGSPWEPNQGFPREQLSTEIGRRLNELATTRRGALEEALRSHRDDVLTRRSRAARDRLQELLSRLPVGPEKELMRVQQQRRSGVLFPELARDLAYRHVALAAEVKGAVERRRQLLCAVTREASKARQQVVAATQLLAPLAIHCDGLIIVLPGGRHDD